MPNFNKLRFIVYEIFDNSQLFMTDRRIREVSETTSIIPREDAGGFK